MTNTPTSTLTSAHTVTAEHPAITNLRTNQRQLDMDGCEVGVSRQALDETLAEIEAMRAEIERLTAEINRRKGDPVTRLHNLVEAAEEIEGAYSLEEWNRIDAENTNLRGETAKAQRRFDYIAEHLPADWCHCTTEKELCEQVAFTVERAEAAERKLAEASDEGAIMWTDQRDAIRRDVMTEMALLADAEAAYGNSAALVAGRIRDRLRAVASSPEEKGGMSDVTLLRIAEQIKPEPGETT